MPRQKVTDDDLDYLTEAELAGMKELQEEEEAERLHAADEEGEEEAEPETKEAAEEPEKKVEKPVEKPAEEEGEAETEEEDGDEEGTDEGEEAGDVEEAGEGEETGDDGDDDEEIVAAATPKHTPAYKMSADEIARIDAIEAEIDVIAEKFDDGELTAKEMRDQQKALAKELDELKDKRTIAKMQSADVTTRWFGTTIPAFLAEHPEYKTGTLRYKLLDQAVKELQAATDDPTNPAILDAAHKKITDEFGGGATKKPNGKANGKGRTIPPTLSGVPASAITETAAKSEFSHLERLKGQAYERALSKLPAEARDRYLQGG